MCKANISTVIRMFSLCLLLLTLTVNANGKDGYIFPDYCRLLTNGKTVTLNLGIYQDGTLFLKFYEREYPIDDPDAFKRGTEQAMDYTQALQRGGESAKAFFASKHDKSPFLLYSSASIQDADKARFFILEFDHQSAANRYPIKISFHDNVLHPQIFDFPPGELQYLQKTIDIALENKADSLAKVRNSINGSK